MTIIAIALLLSGALIGSGITLAVHRRRLMRLEIESWNAARRFYTRMNSEL